VNILNKQLHTAKKRLPSSIVLMWGVRIIHHEKLECYKKLQETGCESWLRIMSYDMLWYLKRWTLVYHYQRVISLAAQSSICWIPFNYGVFNRWGNGTCNVDRFDLPC
jgi:hypothetical protein